MERYGREEVSVWRQVRGFVYGGVFLVAAVVCLFKGWEHLDATHVMVVQDPLDGELHWHTTPGIKVQKFGRVTKYEKRSQYWFSDQTDQGDEVKQSIPIRFNDGGHATISGSLAWEMPLDDDRLTRLHTRYGGHRNIEQQLVRTIVEKAVYMTGPLMSSRESYAERRSDLLGFIDDQINHGIYRTQTREQQVPDPMTGVMRTVNVVQLVERDGNIQRQDKSPLDEFGVRTFNLSINRIPYDEAVEGQIKVQQAAIMQVQTAVAKAKEAEQAAITAEKNGQAEAAKARWEQEVIKARLVTEAQQKLEVAEFDRKAAEQEKQANILRGQGESERKKLVMQADGALEQKLRAWVDVNAKYAAALENIKQPIVPQIQFGGNSSGSQTGAQQFFDLLLAKTARDLQVDPTPNR